MRNSLFGAYVKNDVEVTRDMWKNSISVKFNGKLYKPYDMTVEQTAGAYPELQIRVNLNPFYATPDFVEHRHWVNRFPKIKKVHFNDPVTVVLWDDGTKTIVRAQNDEAFDPEKGLTMAITKKVLGNKGSYFDEIKKWTEPYMKERDELQSLTRAMLMSGILTHYDADLEPPYEEDR
jgi:hypothetical protein